MNKTEKNILTGVGVALAGFLAYRFYKAKQVKKEAEVIKEEAKKAETNPNKTTGFPGPYTGPTDMQRKVMELQSWLGVAVDGIAGPQTNGALKAKLPLTFATLGAIMPANIDKYITLKNGPTWAWL